MKQFERYTIREVSIEKWWNTCNNLVIMRGGHTCVHSYFSRMGDGGNWKEAVIIDFFRSAYLGSGDKDAFMRERKGWSDAADLWKNFKRSYDGLKRLDPDGYLEAIEIGRKELELIGK